MDPQVIDKYKKALAGEKSSSTSSPSSSMGQKESLNSGSVDYDGEYDDDVDD